jgi:UDP-N-acetyl-D-mannosaminuronic acid dehydrogenase
MLNGSSVCVVGLGYIGLPTALLLATNGFSVLGVDTNEAVLASLRSGEPHIAEPGVRELLGRALSSGALALGLRPEGADVFMICVPTPVSKDRTADLSAVRAAAESILPYLGPESLVILESTVPPGTTQNMVVPILRQSDWKVPRSGSRDGLLVAYCPERVLPGKTLHEMIHNDRIVGGVTPAAAAAAATFYSQFVHGVVHQTDVTTAEIVKLAENSFRDVNIALANELAGICWELGSNVWEVVRLANHHPRVHFLSPGPGVGGHCLTTDPWFLVSSAPGMAKLIRSGREINESQPETVCRIIEGMTRDIRDAKVALLGVAYKAGTDDLRDSPTLVIAQWLHSHGYRVSLVDPLVKLCPVALTPLSEAVSDADLIVLLVDHDEFANLEPGDLGRRVRHKRLLDTRNSLDLARWEGCGFEARLLGAGAVPRQESAKPIGTVPE